MIATLLALVLPALVVYVVGGVAIWVTIELTFRRWCYDALARGDDEVYYTYLDHWASRHVLVRAGRTVLTWPVLVRRVLRSKT